MKTDLKEIRWESVDSTDVTQESEKWWVFVNTVINICVLYNATNKFVLYKMQQIHLCSIKCNKCNCVL